MSKIKATMGFATIAIALSFSISGAAFADDPCSPKSVVKEKYYSGDSDREAYFEYVKSLEPGVDLLDIVKNEENHPVIKSHLEENKAIPFYKFVIAYQNFHGCIGYEKNKSKALSLMNEAAFEGFALAAINVMGTPENIRDKKFQKKLGNIFENDSTHMGRSVYHLSQAIGMVGGKTGSNDFSRKDIKKFCSSVMSARDSYPSNALALGAMSSCYDDYRWKRDANLAYAYQWASLLVAKQEPNANIFQRESRMTEAAIKKARKLAYSLADIEAPESTNSTTSTPIPTPQKPKAASDTVISTGTAFFIGGRFMITNEHVVDSGNTIDVKYRGETIEANIVASDRGDDVAVLELVSDFTKLPKCFSLTNPGQVEPGKTIYAAGFPLAQLLSSEGKITDGIINSQNGMLGNPKEFQISSPLQPGNSGGPVFFSDGRLVGIAVSKLRDGENVNFAIKTAVAKIFTELSGVSAICASPMGGISDYQSSIALVEIKG